MKKQSNDHFLKHKKNLESLLEKVQKTGAKRNNQYEILVRGRNGATYYIFISMESLSSILNRGDAIMNNDGIPQAVSGPWNRI